MTPEEEAFVGILAAETEMLIEASQMGHVPKDPRLIDRPVTRALMEVQRLWVWLAAAEGGIPVILGPEIERRAAVGIGTLVVQAMSVQEVSHA